ncbi:polysaccharide deacetylase family protein [Glaciimonas sp. GNP009]|uniref:polysaccharide deacetylase family protein n=2 Tax=Glaciimonas sp. CA11.2 TaxID=3048601 RepID=UPI002AB366B7|nr:polysaccharide deacetylase family protein [Glaciimonas sp. CA11.2]MDY7544679.1 polysaccharide deacetylase family protein [Glaciimonas sp. CA11.2]
MNRFSVKRLVKLVLRKALYDLGLLGLLHRFRNSRTLTTFMFHRVLPRDSDAYRHAEKEFTFSVEGFSACLDFIQRHYQIISLRDVEEAKQTGRFLPDRAALITFDDGWLDTIKYAYPELKRRGLSGVVFIASEVLGSSSEQWWQDALVRVFAEPQSALDLARELGLDLRLSEQAGSQRNHAMAATLAQRPLANRLDILFRYSQDLGLGQQMMRRTDLIDLDRAILALAAHGHTHAPLTAIFDPKADLQRAHDMILEQGGTASLSFPHGTYNKALVDIAEDIGFSTLFSSDPWLTDTRRAQLLPRVLGRIHLPENEWTCNGGHISFPQLATFLFFRPIVGNDC